MIVQHTARPRATALAFLRRRAGLRRFAIALGVCGLVVGSTLWGLYEGMRLYRDRVAPTLADLLDDIVATRLAIVPNWIAGWVGSDAERVVLDIKHAEFQKLAYQREVALRQGVMVAKGDEEFVKARVRRHGEPTRRAEVRLKGDWVDHLSGPKWSFRVKLKDDQTLFGMETFSLQHPKTRRFVYEWVFHQALAREDIIPLRYEFVELTLNGKDLGVYALEEHFDERTVEKARRREGPILKFDESLHWADIAAMGEPGDESPTGMRGFRAGAVDAFRAATLMQDPAQRELLLGATSLLEAFRAGELPVAAVFDSKKLATYFALLDLLGAEHAGVWINLRFYYDPIALRLEPVGFDGNAGSPLHQVIGSAELLEEDHAGFRPLVFADPAFTAEYVAQLERVSDPAYLEALLADIGQGLERNLRILHKEFPWQRFDADILRENQRVIRNVLAPTKGLHAYLDRADADSGKVDLEIGNLSQFPIELIAAKSGAVELAPAEASVFGTSLPSGNVAYALARFDVQGAVAWSDPLAATLEVQYRVLGSGQVRKEKVFPRPRGQGLPAADLLRRPANAGEFGFVEVDEAAREIRVRPGVWTVDRDLIVPAGYRLRAGAGTRLDLVRSAAIVSRSPLELRGSSGDPVVFVSSDGAGQGLLVLDAGSPSTLEHVAFLGLRSLDREGFQLMGAVTFYRSPVSISHAEFGNNVAEDGLSLVRSPFEIEEVLFHDASADAFDADFSDGAIRRSVFRGMANDGIEISGGRVDVASVRIEKAGNRGLSAAEDAKLGLRDVEVRDSRIGVASRDRSTVDGEALRVFDVKVGFALYAKKSEFGPAAMELRDARLEGVATPYLLEQGSKLLMEGRDVAPNATGVDAELYGQPANG